MDGKVKDSDRKHVINSFLTSKEGHIFLLTTKVGGLGLNLARATKVVIFDPDWNPMVDLQAMNRALRLQQDDSKPQTVEVYRLIVDDSVEEKVYHRQIFKKFMAQKVLSNPR